MEAKLVSFRYFAAPIQVQIGVLHRLWAVWQGKLLIQKAQAAWGCLPLQSTTHTWYLKTVVSQTEKSYKVERNVMSEANREM